MSSPESLYPDRLQQPVGRQTDFAMAERTTEDQSTPPPDQPADNLAQRFMQTLQQIEASGQVEPLVELFAEDADLSNLAMPRPLQGRDSIRQFWQNYLAVFDQIRSHFTHVSQGQDTITLEWTSEGSRASGEPFSYRGVSILETQNGQVQHFRTYYDSAAFLPQNA